MSRWSLEVWYQKFFYISETPFLLKSMHLEYLLMEKIWKLPYNLYIALIKFWTLWSQEIFTNNYGETKILWIDYYNKLKLHDHRNVYIHFHYLLSAQCLELTKLQRTYNFSIYHWYHQPLSYLSYMSHLSYLLINWKDQLPMAMFTLYRIACWISIRIYWIGLLFTLEHDNFGKNFILDSYRSTVVLQVILYVSDRFLRHFNC